MKDFNLKDIDCDLTQLKLDCYFLISYIDKFETFTVLKEYNLAKIFAQRSVEFYFDMAENFKELQNENQS